MLSSARTLRDAPLSSCFARCRACYSVCFVVNSILLEISVETAEAAVAAERGGAQRIELCAQLNVGGLTPSEKLMRLTRESVRVPTFAMIRPRSGDFVYSPEDLSQMRRDIAAAQRLGMDGIVLGVLTRERHVDIKRARELVIAAQPLPVTFHRAFDDVADLNAALDDVIETGAARVLTSGGAASAAAGIENVARLVAAAGQRVIILPGGGINASNAMSVARQSGAREIHSGLGSVLSYGQEDYKLFEKEVRVLAAQLANVT
jgi:copper homeostasis protein